MSNSLLDRHIERELARAEKLEEHRMKGAALGIGPEDHARLTCLFIKAGLGPSEFRGLTGADLAGRIREVWAARAASANA